MSRNSLAILKNTLTFHGNPENPIPPGAMFATLLPEDEFRATEGLEEFPYPPVPQNNPGCKFNPADNTLTATLWGRAVLTSEGIKVKPAWRLSKDMMHLSVEVSPEDFFGNEVTMEQLCEEFPGALSPIADRLNFDPLRKALAETSSTGERTVVTVASGCIPGQPQDAQLKLMIKSGRTAGTLRKDGSIDFRERAGMESVAAGEVLGELHPAMEGQAGNDLLGTPIPARKAETVSIDIGPGVDSMTDDNDVTILTAARTGVVRFSSNVLDVVDIFEIEGDVDYNTGNINAKQGSIHIKGDVKSGFRVECPGDVVIEGLVEEADIKAGGLVIAGGVIMNGNNTITAKDNVTAHFFRNAVIKSGGDVEANQEISHCTIVADGKVTALGGSGIICGGHIISGDDITAQIFGNKACTQTTLEIRLPSQMSERLAEAKKEFEAELEELDKAIGVDFDLSSLMSAPEEDRRILAELIRVRSRIQGEIRDIESESSRHLFEARKALVVKRVSARDMAYCGVSAIIGGPCARVKKEIAAPSFYLDLESQTIKWN